MTGSMSDVVAEWTRSSAHLKLVLDSADENDLLVAALVARLCLLKRTYLSEVVTSVNAKIFTEAETIEDALNHYPLVHSMLESVKEYQLDQVDLELRNIDECWNLLFHFSDCTGDAEVRVDWHVWIPVCFLRTSELCLMFGFCCSCPSRSENGVPGDDPQCHSGAACPPSTVRKVPESDGVGYDHPNQ